MKRNFLFLPVILLFCTALLSGCGEKNTGWPSMSVSYQDAQGEPRTVRAWVIGDSWPLPASEDGNVQWETIEPVGIKYRSECAECVIPNSGANGEIFCTLDRTPDSVELYRFGAEFAPDDWLTLDQAAAEPLTQEHGRYSIPNPEIECTYWVKATYDDHYAIYLFMITDADVTTVKTLSSLSTG